MTAAVHRLVEIIAEVLSSPNQTVHGFEVRAMLAILCVSIASGIVGSLIIGNRMAFFSDALAHSAYAGVSLTLLGIVLATGATSYLQAEPYFWTLPWVMCLFGALVGVLIALIREKTSLENDTIIGVFFAFSLGLAALLLPALKRRVNIHPEHILFGDLLFMQDEDLLSLMILVIVCVGIMVWKYNAFVFSSVNVSLARSRGLPVRFNQYLMIIMLALVVNLSIKAMGILLINAFLIVPAAAAANVSSNLRRMFWITLIGSVICGIVGYRASHYVSLPMGTGDPVRFGPAGLVIVTCVTWFFASVVFRILRSRIFGTVQACATCSDGHVHGEYQHTHG